MDKIERWIGGVSVVVMAAIVALPTLVWLLIGLIVADIVTGLARAYCAGEICSSVSRIGITKKVVTLILVGICYALEHYIKHSIPIGAAGAAFYSGNELLSIIENAGKLGLPIAPGLRKGLAALNKDDERKEDDNK